MYYAVEPRCQRIERDVLAFHDLLPTASGIRHPASGIQPHANTNTNTNTHLRCSQLVDHFKINDPHMSLAGIQQSHRCLDVASSSRRYLTGAGDIHHSLGVDTWTCDNAAQPRCA